MTNPKPLFRERDSDTMETSSRSVHVGLAEALTKEPPPTVNLAVPIFARGSLVVELYTPGHSPPCCWRISFALSVPVL